MEEWPLMANFLKKGFFWVSGFILILFFFPNQGHAEFALDVETIEGIQDLDFGSVESYSPDGEPSSESVSRQILLMVRTDLQKPYRVTQILERKAVNENLNAIKPEAIQYTTVLRQGDGLLRAPSRRNLELGEQEIFLSNGTGDAAEILIQYDLSVPPAEQAGYYRTSIRYRLYTTT